MPRFSGKTVIITGSSNGIGRSAALLFAQEGANVTITGRNSDRLQETKQQILKSGIPENQVNSVVADVTTSEGQDELIKSTLEKFGKIDILVNNAGAAHSDPTGALASDQGLDVYHKNMQLNIQSVVEMTRKVKPYLIESKGEIVNVSSIAGGPHAQPDFPYYSMAKAALDQYTRAVAIDLIQYGVRVNSVSPGVVATGFAGLWDWKIRRPKNEKKAIPAMVAGTPEDIAWIILFLADRKMSSYIIGQSIVADGGTTLVLGIDFNKAMQ